MAESVTVRVNGKPFSVPAGTTVAVAVMLSAGHSRVSISGEPRSPLCGMGTCFECRVEIDGRAQRRSCQTLCQPNMEIVTRG